MATTTLTLTSEECPEELEKREVYDLDFANDLRDVLKQLALNARDTAEREKWKRQSVLLALYTKKTENINEVRTRYMLGRRVRHEADNIGRLVAEGGIGLQTFCRDVRNALAMNYYHDLDIVNSQPVILAQLCDRNGWACPMLKRYIETREEVIGDVVELLRREGNVREEDLRDEAKKRIIGLYNGGTPEGLTPFVREMSEEAYRIRGNVWNHYSGELKWLAKCDRRTGKAVSWVYQTEERKCLMAIARALEARGRRMDVLIFDGGLVRKREGEVDLPKAMLREIEEDVFRETGYRIALVVKPMTTTLERTGGTDNEYTERKRQFEETGWKRHTHFKLRFPPMFVAIDDDRVEQLHKGELLQNEEDNLLSDGSSFIKRWLEDPSKREYDRMVFEPGHAVGEHNYNMFRGLKVQPVQGDWSIFRTLLNLLVSHDELGYEYVENWCARRLQRIGEKSGVCLIFQGRKGVGKDTLWDRFGSIFGPEHFHNTSRPEHTVFARFTSQLARSLLIKFEEANFTTNKDNEDQLKGIITSRDAQIEKKGHPIISVNSYVDCVMTTNQEVPIPMTDDERRFAAFKCSEEKRGDTEFWAGVYRGLADGKQLAAWVHHLLHKDISNWSPTPVYKTRYYKDLVGVCAPLHARFFCDWVRLMGEDGQNDWVELGSSLELMRAMTTRFPKFPWDNHKKFGMMMRDNYTDVGVIEKVEGRLHNSYRVIPANLRAHLEAKGWWD